MAASGGCYHLTVMSESLGCVKQCVSEVGVVKKNNEFANDCISDKRKRFEISLDQACMACGVVELLNEWL